MTEPQTLTKPSEPVVEPQRPVAEPPESTIVPRPEHRGRVAALVVLVLLAAVALAAWRVFFSTPKAPANVVFLSGRIEGDDAAVATKATGRVLEVRVREGDSVNAGDTIAVLDDQQIRAREEQARAALMQAEAKAKSARDQIAVFTEQLKQGEAEVAQQEASYELALFDKEAYTRLAKTGAVSERQGKQAATTAEQQGAAVAAARQRVAATRVQIAQQQAEVASAGANIAQSRAQLAEAQANRQDLIIKAPFSGTVATRTAEPGEVLATGTPVITLIDLSKVYLRGFVPVGEIGKVKVRQPAHVYLDSNPNQPLDAYVGRIDPQATFTPENTYFREDRVKQVVGVKVQLQSGFGYAKPGMPADGEILVAGDRWPEGRRRK